MIARHPYTGIQPPPRKRWAGEEQRAGGDEPSDSVDTAAALISEKEPDIVFLDIEIIGGSGFDVIRRFPKRTFLFIFISAYDSYAKDSAHFPSTKFLLKPINLDELRDAVSL
jgi:two-component system, LytTR family, response regulator